MRRYRERDLFIWRGDDFSLSWAIDGSWLVVRIGAIEADPDWLDVAIGGGGRGLGGDPALARARARAAELSAEVARRHGWKPEAGAADVFGLIRTGALVEDLGLAGQPCVARLAAAAPTVIIGADAAWDRVAGFIDFEVADEVAAALGAVGDPPHAGMAALVAGSPVGLLWRIPPATLERGRRAWQCDELGESPITDLAGGFLPGVTSIAIAGETLELSKLSVEAVALVTGAAPGLLDEWLDELPMRSALERKIRVGDRDVVVIGGRLGIPEIAYHAGPVETVIGSPVAMLERALGGPPATSAPLALLRLSPARIPNLVALFERAGDLLHAADDLAELARDLGRYRWGQVELELRGGALRLGAAMELR